MALLSLPKAHPGFYVQMIPHKLMMVPPYDFFFFFAFTMVQKQYTFRRDYNVDLLMG